MEALEGGIRDEATVWSKPETWKSWEVIIVDLHWKAEETSIGCPWEMEAVPKECSGKIKPPHACWLPLSLPFVLFQLPFYLSYYPSGQLSLEMPFLAHPEVCFSNLLGRPSSVPSNWQSRLTITVHVVSSVKQSLPLPCWYPSWKPSQMLFLFLITAPLQIQLMIVVTSPPIMASFLFLQEFFVQCFLSQVRYQF